MVGSWRDSGLGVRRNWGPNTKSASVSVLGGSGDLLCLGFFMSGMGVMKIWGYMKTLETGWLLQGRPALFRMAHNGNRWVRKARDDEKCYLVTCPALGLSTGFGGRKDNSERALH